MSSWEEHVCIWDRCKSTTWRKMIVRDRRDKRGETVRLWWQRDEEDGGLNEGDINGW